MKKAKTIKGIKVAEEDTELGILLKAWVKAIERYTDANERDNPWWYNERASLSVLAGAAWSLKGWHALEEFSTLKRLRTIESGVDAGSLRNGRCDLYVQSPTTSYAIEAKQAVQSIGSRSDGHTYMARAMQGAWEDTGDLSNWEADRRFAVTFVVPTLPMNDVVLGKAKTAQVCASKVEQFTMGWLADQTSFIGPSMKQTAFAFVFPKLGNSHYLFSDKYFPGVVVIFEERYRANRRR